MNNEEIKVGDLVASTISHNGVVCPPAERPFRALVVGGDEWVPPPGADYAGHTFIPVRWLTGAQRGEVVLFPADCLVLLSDPERVSR